MAQETQAAARAEEHAAGGHASLRTYVIVGIILTVVTAVEVAISEMPSLEAIVVPALLILSFAKFMLVVLFYMHLKFDSKIFSRTFYGLSLLATMVIVGLILFVNVLGDYRP